MTAAEGGRIRRQPNQGMARRLLRTAALGALGGVVGAVLVAHIDARPAHLGVAVAGVKSDVAPVARIADVSGEFVDESPDRPPRIAVTAVATPAPTAAPPASAPTLAPATATPVPVAWHPAPAPVHPAPAPPPPPPPPPAPPPAAAPPGSVWDIVQLVNQDRASAGLAALTWSSALGRAAATHASQNAAADQMSHDGLVQDVDAQGVHWNTLGECLGWNGGSAPDPSMINQMWMNSSEHRSIILGSYTTLGVGWAQSSTGKWYVSLIVIT